MQLVARRCWNNWKLLESARLRRIPMRCVMFRKWLRSCRRATGTCPVRGAWRRLLWRYRLTLTARRICRLASVRSCGSHCS